jgi:hypothetical protein
VNWREVNGWVLFVALLIDVVGWATTEDINQKETLLS